MKNLNRFLLLIILVVVFLLAVNLVYAAQYYRVNRGQTVGINEWGTCKKVTASTSCPGDLFVPTNSEPEWRTFRNNKPSCVPSLGDCCTSTCSTGPGCRTSAPADTDPTSDECCGAGTCYKCLDGSTWNGNSCVWPACAGHWKVTTIDHKTGDFGGISGADQTCAAHFGSGWHAAIVGGIIGNHNPLYGCTGDNSMAIWQTNGMQSAWTLMRSDINSIKERDCKDFSYSGSDEPSSYTRHFGGGGGSTYCNGDRYTRGLLCTDVNYKRPPADPPAAHCRPTRNYYYQSNTAGLNLYGEAGPDLICQVEFGMDYYSPHVYDADFYSSGQSFDGKPLIDAYSYTKYWVDGTYLPPGEYPQWLTHPEWYNLHPKSWPAYFDPDCNGDVCDGNKCQCTNNNGYCTGYRICMNYKAHTSAIVYYTSPAGGPFGLMYSSCKYTPFSYSPRTQTECTTMYLGLDNTEEDDNDFKVLKNDRAQVMCCTDG